MLVAKVGSSSGLVYGSTPQAVLAAVGYTKRMKNENENHDNDITLSSSGLVYGSTPQEVLAAVGYS